MRHIGRNYRVVRARELHDAITSRRRGEPFPLAITFDDDLSSHRNLAMPVLQQLGLTATFFLCGASLDGRSAFWWERLSRALGSGINVEASV